jgi:micrococcal nuclease
LRDFPFATFVVNGFGFRFPVLKVTFDLQNNLNLFHLFMIKLISLLGFLALSSFTNYIKTGDSISGKVISILDGDTYDMLIPGNIIIRIRMEGIDAPERGMPFYKVSKQYLADLCFSKTVTIHVTGIDIHNRVLAYTYTNDETELSHEMIKAGLAWHYLTYNTDPVLADLEATARIQKAGLWFDANPMAPWTNRSLHRQGISTKDSFNIEVCH